MAPKKVTFAVDNNNNNNDDDTNIVIEIHHVENYSLLEEEYKQDIWFSRQEEETFKMRGMKLAQRMAAQETTTTTTTMEAKDDNQDIELYDSLRGLEHVSNPYTIGRLFHQRRSTSIALVLATQQVCQQKGKVNYEVALAHIYTTITIDAINDAIQRAKQDETQAMTILANRREIVVYSGQPQEQEPEPYHKASTPSPFETTHKSNHYHHHRNNNNNKIAPATTAATMIY